MIQQTLGVFFAPVLVSIPIEADSVLEPDETFTVRLVPAPGQNLEGILISPDMATITIVGKYRHLYRVNAGAFHHIRNPNCKFPIDICPLCPSLQEILTFPLRGCRGEFQLSTFPPDDKDR